MKILLSIRTLGPFFLIAGIILMSTLELRAQEKLSKEQILKYYNEAKARGMSDEEIEKAALANGYTLADILNFKNQLSESNQETLKEHVRETASIRENRDSSPEKTIKVESVAVTDEIRKIFGSSFFSSASSTFEPNLRIPTPINYVIGPEDEITIDLSGKYSEVFKLPVSPEGTVRLLNFPPIYVSGLTVEQAKQRIANKLGTTYSGVHTSISLTKIRSIRVSVTGLSRQPGTYTLSSLATAFHALKESGGPSFNGSFRNIQVLRSNRVIKEIDLYKYVINADASDNIMLQDQDVILIRPYQTRVALEGQVKTPALFEAKPDETLATIIGYAGGLSDDAYSYSIGYRRNTGKEFKVGQVSNSDFAKFNLQNGDKFEVGKILDRFENKVTIEGAVFRQGDYAIEPGLMTVLELINKADGLTENAFLNRGIIQRQNEQFEGISLSFDVRKLMNREIPDIKLLRNDKVIIKTIQDLREVENVNIKGEVIKPGEFRLYKGMTLPDLIFLAGGFTHSGIPYRIEVSRRLKGDSIQVEKATETVRIFDVEVDQNLQWNSQDKEFLLEAFDHVTIRQSTVYTYQKQVYIIGEVNYPGPYTVKTEFERVADLVKRAGGLKETAFIEGAQFRRNEKVVALDLSSVLRKPETPSNLLLFNGDTLIIPRRLETVEIVGQVLNPSILNFEPSFNYKNYLNQAGGYTDIASKRRVFVTHPNGRTDRSKKFLFFTKRPKIQPGSRITIPTKSNDDNKEKMSRTERLMIISTLTTVTIALIRFVQDIF